MDPNETGVITFSKIIITLASDLIEYNGITIPLLHKIYYSKDFPITS